MSVIRRCGTSLLGTVLHTVAGLSAIAFGCQLVAVAAVIAPSFVGELGLNLLVSGGTVAENVSQLRAETFVSLPVLGLGLLAQALVQGSGALALSAALLVFALRLFGGPIVLTLLGAASLGIWYGLRESASEAVVAGIVVWGLVGLAGLGTLLRSAAGFGLVIGGLQGVYYGVRAWAATELATPVADFIP